MIVFGGGYQMTAQEVLRTLQITRPTLTKYVKNGVIKKKQIKEILESKDDSTESWKAGDKKE